MANQNSKNFVEMAMDAQKNLVDTVVENTKKLANGNTLVKETVEKGNEWYTNWMNNQKSAFEKTTEKASEAGEQAKAGASQMQDFFSNWMNSQVNWSKQLWETNQGMLKNMQQQATSTAQNPMEQFNSNVNNMTNGFNNWMNMASAQNNMNNFMSQFQNGNPFTADGMKTATDNATNMFSQWQSMLQNSFAEWQKTFQNGTTADAYRNMANTTEGFTRFYQMWAPMWESIQNKTFNMEQYKQFMNPAQYQQLMDQYFSFLPEGSRQYMQQMTAMSNDWTKNAGQTFGNGFNQMRQAMQQAMPAGAGHEYFTNMMTGYQNWQNSLQNAISPIVRMMSPNQDTKNMLEWNDIANRMMVFNIKNSELQYMIYSQGGKVMDQLAENITNKMQHGEEVKSVVALYQEWLGLSDKTFVSLFESDEYSQLMAEVSALQMKLRKDMEAQVEKSLVNIPVATRSEMDELYKTIYDLKKQVRQLEKMMEMEEEVPAPAPAAKKATNTRNTKR
jgi:hypothetical protein